MRPLILGLPERRLLDELRQFAESHLLDAQALVALVSKGTAIGDQPGRKVEIPFGYRVAFTVEQHPGGKWYRHISVSVETPGHIPHPVAVDQIADCVGFIKNGPHRISYIEGGVAVNLLQECERPETAHQTVAE